MPRRPEAGIVPGRWPAPAAAVALTQEADDTEDALPGRESRLRWFCDGGRKPVNQGDLGTPSFWGVVRARRCFTCIWDLSGGAAPRKVPGMGRLSTLLCGLRH